MKVPEHRAELGSIMNRRMLFVDICQENREIVKNNEYTYNESDGVKVHFDHSLQDHQRVEVYSPEKLKELVEKYQNPKQSIASEKIQVIDGDSFATPTDCVLNFANSRHPGGGYLSGASAQEEALCRQSTLYASIDSENAGTMYNSNMHVKDLDTDYLLLSPCVEVFRDCHMNLLEHPHTTAVISVAAPNLFGRARGVDISGLREYYRQRIRHILCVAVENGYHSVTLGAWGCGAFGNDPFEVADAFKDVLVNEGFGVYFDKVVFAIPDGRNGNYRAFCDVLSNILIQYVNA
ncbi:MAG: TIGR02452 family protein [Lachnospiraceae bacterium]|uniref:TIGR02452 family protein n=1 Tax=Candidatus Weimeria bifida TaxID=2599074 RepID=A0A6N7IYQ6_9FIRM|nr:TIGR02452 family protein [Candidatus Weimeria bifida]RRF97205.1 MAG: TIGR02452 family protein [Lachnospiraceae bacterium]